MTCTHASFSAYVASIEGRQGPCLIHLCFQEPDTFRLRALHSTLKEPVSDQRLGTSLTQGVGWTKRLGSLEKQVLLYTLGRQGLQRTYL